MCAGISERRQLTLQSVIIVFFYCLFVLFYIYKNQLHFNLSWWKQQSNEQSPGDRTRVPGPRVPHEAEPCVSPSHPVSIVSSCMMSWSFIFKSLSIFVSPLTFLRCIAQSLWQFAAQLCPFFSTLSVNKKVFCSFRLGLSRSLPRREKARKWVKLRQIICLSNLRRKIWKKEKENRKQINCATPQNRLEITRCWHTDMKPWKA